MSEVTWSDDRIDIEVDRRVWKSTHANGGEATAIMREIRNDMQATIDALRNELATLQADAKQQDSDWFAMLQAIIAVEPMSEWSIADDDAIWEQFDPWQALREIGETLATLQAATPVGGGEGVHPSWSQAPEWAQWWCADADGKAWWEEYEPEVYFSMWNHRSTFMTAGAVEIPLGIDWRVLKQRRPHAQQDSQEEQSHG